MLSVVAVPISQEIADKAGLGDEFLDYLENGDPEGNAFCRAIEYYCPECFLTDFTKSVVSTSSCLKPGTLYLCWEGITLQDKEIQNVLQIFSWQKSVVRGSYTIRT